VNSSSKRPSRPRASQGPRAWFLIHTHDTKLIDTKLTRVRFQPHRKLVETKVEFLAHGVRTRNLRNTHGDDRVSRQGRSRQGRSWTSRTPTVPRRSVAADNRWSGEILWTDFSNTRSAWKTSADLADWVVAAGRCRGGSQPLLLRAPTGSSARTVLVSGHTGLAVEVGGTFWAAEDGPNHGAPRGPRISDKYFRHLLVKRRVDLTQRSPVSIHGWFCVGAG
jgi:hypothetical protein